MHDVVILCGGLGTRLRSVLKNKPKALAFISNRPFLDVILEFFFNKGFRNFILCVGYKAKIIKEHYEKSPFFSYLQFSQEKKPLGTGGAIKNAERFIKGENFLVVNGDSFCEMDIKKFVDFHLSFKKALVSIVVSRIDNRSDCGYLELDRKSFLITSFAEKRKSRSFKYINAGIYVFRKEVLSLIPKDKKYSLEESLFPSLVKSKKIFGYPVRSKVIDIGTPKRYKEALKYFIH